jgi:hypothetical protein
VLVSVGLVFLGACGSGSRPAATEGVAGRTAPAPVPVAAAAISKSPCFSSAGALPAGRDAAGTPHYLLTFSVKGKPGDEAALIEAIAPAACQQELRATVAAVDAEVTRGGAKAVVDVSYLTAAGRRLTLP